MTWLLTTSLTESEPFVACRVGEQHQKVAPMSLLT